jgi:hypothetical protein
MRQPKPLRTKEIHTMPNINLRQSDLAYLRELLADRKTMVKTFSGLIHATDTERAGMATEHKLIEGIEEALA